MVNDRDNDIEISDTDGETTIYFLLNKTYLESNHLRKNSYATNTKPPINCWDVSLSLKSTCQNDFIQRGYR
jgi:hypothetical protein